MDVPHFVDVFNEINIAKALVNAFSRAHLFCYARPVLVVSLSPTLLTHTLWLHITVGNSERIGNRRKLLNADTKHCRLCCATRGWWQQHGGTDAKTSYMLCCLSLTKTQEMQTKIMVHMICGSLRFSCDLVTFEAGGDTRLRRQSLFLDIEGICRIITGSGVDIELELGTDRMAWEGCDNAGWETFDRQQKLQCKLMQTQCSRIVFGCGLPCITPLSGSIWCFVACCIIK